VKFEWPLALVAIAVVPLAAVAYLQVERRRTRFAVRLPNVDVLASILPSSGDRSWRRFVPPALFLLAVALAAVALARPEVARSLQREESTIVLMIDTSGSMIANDVRPTRLAAAQEAARRFVRRLPGRVRIGVVIFSDNARVASPVTDDHTLAIQGLDRMTAFGGTALGDAIARAVELLRSKPAGADPQPAGEVPPSAIVLLSDGAQNRGRRQPLEGAALAKRVKVPVYTVALGTAAGTIRVSDGAFSETLSVPPDPQTLKEIALETGGTFYSAADQRRLNAVYEGLASRLSTQRVYREATFVFLGAASLALLAAGVLSALWLPRLP
jgi:Ca-activated chloride channel family protein